MNLRLIAGFLAGVLLVSSAYGTVTLKLSNDVIGSVEGVTVPEGGGEFDVYIKLVATSESTNGVSTTLFQESGPSSDVLRISAYDTISSAYPFLAPDSATVLAVPGSRLDPSTDVLLGGLVSSTPKDPGSYTVAHLKILVDAAALPGTYIIKPDPTTTEVISDQDIPLATTIRTFSVTVTPEPSALAVLGLAGLVLIRRRNRQ